MTLSFRSLPIAEVFIETLIKNEINTPTAIQLEAIPPIAEGRDIIAQSQTGTGKTLAYLLPALTRMNPKLQQVQCVIVAPTRELGMQISQEIDKLCEGTEIKGLALIGGAAIKRQIDKLRKQPQIIVGTPGRLAELIRLRKLSMHHVSCIIIDEVDQVFELGSIHEVESIMKSAMRDRQVLFFSATITDKIRHKALKWMKEPVYVQINPAQRIAETLEHGYFVCDKRDKLDILRRLVRLYNPKSAIVFVNETEDIGELIAKIEYMGITVAALYGDAPKISRTRTLSDVRQGRVQLLVATDVAARGLDLPDVTLVLNLDLPLDSEHYIHRSGRTGRMGRQGTVLSICERNQVFIMNKYMKELNIVIEPKEMAAGKLIERGVSRPKQASIRFEGKQVVAPTMKPVLTEKKRSYEEHEETRLTEGQEVSASAPEHTIGNPKGDVPGIEAAADKTAIAKANIVSVSVDDQPEKSVDRQNITSPSIQNAQRKPSSGNSKSTTQTKVSSNGKASKKDLKADKSKVERERDRKNKGAPKWLKEKQVKDK